ncbi:hypothetical protein ACQEVZ_27925 [Dactylosporangium sp. CA-152071]|uniref:hypothetical protein n=1 Tax=Dactylosporangium sp. CA-152071 TaxID=3239933 RepID=UPI003D8EA087
MTLAQLRPRPAFCPDPAPQPGTTPIGIRLLPAPAAIPLAPAVTQVWAGPSPWKLDGSRVVMPPGRYRFFATRLVRQADFWQRDPGSSAWYQPLEQTDVATWESTDMPTFGLWQRSWDVPDWQPREPYPFVRPAVVPLADPSDPADPRYDLWLAASAWSTDPATLARQIAMWDPDDRRATYVLAAIALRYRHILPTMAQHQAALAVLCSTPGLRLDGPTIDQAGRPGIAVHAEHDHGHGTVDHSTLILDAHTWRPQSWGRVTTIDGVVRQSPHDRIELLLDAGYRTVIT